MIVDLEVVNKPELKEMFFERPANTPLFVNEYFYVTTIKVKAPESIFGIPGVLMINEDILYDVLFTEDYCYFELKNLLLTNYGNQIPNIWWKGLG